MNRKLTVSIIAASLLLAAGAASAADEAGRSQQPVSDTVITAKVKAELVGNDTTKARDIDVSTQDGIVKLTGVVDSATAKQQAAQEAQTVKGVARVDNQLTVKQ